MIKKITIQLGGKEVEITIEEAKSLKSALDELFGKEVVRIERIHDNYPWQYVPYTAPVYTQPTWISPIKPEIWCNDQSKGITVSGSHIATSGYVQSSVQ